MKQLFMRKNVRGKFYYRMFKFFLLILSLTFIISCYSYYSIKESLEREFVTDSSNMVSSIARQADKEFDEIGQACRLISKSMGMLDYTRKKIEYKDLIVNQVMSLKDNNSFLNHMLNVKTSLDEIAVYFQTNQFILSNYGIFQLDQYFEQQNRYEKLNEELFNKIVSDKLAVNILETDRMTRSYDNDISQKVIPIIYCYEEENTRLSVLVNIKDKYIQSVLEEIKKGEKTVLYIVDKNGKVINSTGVIPNESGEFFQSAGELRDGEFIESGDARLAVFSEEVRYTGWKVYAFVPMSEFMEKQFYVLKIMVLINGIIILLGVVMTFSFSRRLYSPVANLISLLEDSSPKKSNKSINEMEYIAENLQWLKNTNQDLTGKIQKVGPYIQGNIIRNIVLYGDHSLDEKEILELFKGEKVKLDRKYYILSEYRLVFSAEFRKDFIEEERMRIKEGVFKVIKESLLHRFEDSVCVDLGDGSFLAVTNGGDHDLRDQYCRLVQQINTILKEDAQYVKMLVCVGRQLESLQMLPGEFTSVRAALEHWNTDHPDFLIPLENGMKNNEVHLPSNLEGMLDNVVESSNMENIMGFIEGVFEKTYKNSRSVAALKKLSSVLSELCDKTAERYNVEPDGEIKEELKKITNSWDFNGAKSVFIRWIGRIISCKDESSADEERRKIFREYFENNYMHQNLTLERMASDFNLHCNYLSRRFKALMGENFSDYLSAYRIKKAGELLESTELSIDTVAEQVGIISRATFNRLFKKYTGVSPATFRLIHK